MGRERTCAPVHATNGTVRAPSGAAEDGTMRELRPGVWRRLSPLLELPVELVLPAQAQPAARAALERAPAP